MDNGFSILIIFFLVITYIYYQISVFKIERVSININKKNLDKKIKIIHITDYHNNNLINKNKLLQSIKDLNPHLVVLTGDMIDSRTRDLSKTISLLKEIKKINENVYFVSGNHEINNKRRDDFERRIEEIGIYNLDYKYKKMDIDGIKFNLVGISFNDKNYNFTNYEKMLKEFLEDFTILLSHSPYKALESKKLKSDLILSGHMHGGQVRLPFIGAIISSKNGFFPKYNKGLYNVRDTKLYIDSGLGNGKFPIRAFNRIQFSYIEIK